MNTPAMIRELAFAEANLSNLTKKEIKVLLRLSKDTLERVSASRTRLKKTTRQKERKMLNLLVS